MNTQALLLLIDGNNLAHFLYTNLVPGQKMTPADGQRLIEHVRSYARSYPVDLAVELCFDRSPDSTPPLLDNLRIYSAEYPQTGDDLLLGRFWFHHQAAQPCLVITNDEAILDEVTAAHGQALRVSDFVRRAGLVTPVFRAPDELPVVTQVTAADPEKDSVLSLGASIYFRIAREEEDQPGSLKFPPAQGRGPRPSVAAKPAALLVEEPVEEPELQTWEDEGGATARPDEGFEDQPADGNTATESPYYFLTIETWPIEEGVRFLLNSFCPRHRAEYQDLLSAFDPSALRPSDLRALAELLLHACGSEPGFARQGALMARVRLALLQARGEPLSLEELAEQTGLKLSGLRGRIKAKAGRWVAKLTP